MNRFVKLIICVIILHQLIVLTSYYYKSVTLHHQYSLEHYKDATDIQDATPKIRSVHNNYLKIQRKIFENSSPTIRHKPHRITFENSNQLKPHKKIFGNVNTFVKQKTQRKKFENSHSAVKHKTQRKREKIENSNPTFKHNPKRLKETKSKPNKSAYQKQKAKYQQRLPLDIFSRIPVYGSSVYQKKNGTVLTSRTDIGIKCEPLIQQNSIETQRIQSQLEKYDKIPLSPEFYINVTASCDRYIQSRGFITEVTQEEWDFPLAFGILMHKEVELLERLLRAIYRPSNFYFIHVDAKAPKSLLKAVSDIVNCFENVHIASRLVEVKWGQYSVFQADLNCMDDSLKFDWKYYINLAGSEFPLKTNLEMVAILKAFKGASSISGKPFRSGSWRIRMSKIGDITGFDFMKGSQHIIANRKFIEFIRTAPVALKLAERLKNASHPHETYYNSIYFTKHLKVPGSYNGSAIGMEEYEGMARFKMWTYNKLKECSGKVVRAICIFGIRELSLLTKEPHLFCNKFHEDFMPIVLDCLEAWLFDKIKQEMITGKAQVNTTIYSSMDFVKNQIR